MKRYLNKTLLIIAICSATLVMSSCLKNNDYYVDFSNYKPSVELPLSAKYVNKPFGVNWSPDTTTFFKVYINVASVDPLKTAVTATLDLDSTWIAEYNMQQSAAAKQAQENYLEDTSHHRSDPTFPYEWTSMEILPDSLYAISVDSNPTGFPFELTVPANQRQTFADVLIHTDKFPDGHNYVLPFTISKGSIDVSSWKHLGLWFISSPFSGTFTHYTASSPDLGISKTGTITLETVDQHTVKQAGFLDTYSGSTTYTFLGDGSVDVTAVSGSDLGAKVIESNSNPATGEFYVKYKAIGYLCEETFKR